MMGYAYKKHPALAVCNSAQNFVCYSSSGAEFLITNSAG